MKIFLFFAIFVFTSTQYAQAWSEYYDDSPSEETQYSRVDDEFKRDPDYTVIKGCYHSPYCAGLDSGAKTVGICKAHGGRSYKTVALTCKNL